MKKSKLSNTQNPTRPINRSSKVSRNKNKNMKRTGNPKVHLTSCALNYSRAQINPFDDRLWNSLPCIPDNLILPSQKICTRYRGTVSIGTDNFGQLVVNFTQNNNDIVQAVASTAEFRSTIVKSATAAPDVKLYKNVSYPYAANGPILTRSNSLPASRTVGCGVRVRYIGSELQRGGLIYSNVLNQSASTHVGGNLADIIADPATRSYPVDRGWKTICYRMSDPEGAEYVRHSYGISETNQLTSLGSGLFLFYGDAGNQFEFEVINFAELIPTSLVRLPYVSASESDITGMSIVRSYASSLATSDAGQAALSGLSSFLKTHALGLLSGVLNVPALGPAALALEL